MIQFRVVLRSAGTEDNRSKKTYYLHIPTNNQTPDMNIQTHNIINIILL